jgi:UPF0042 nucleotide-binding protein
MASESPDHRQRILLVTGMLGAGKTTTLRALEDLGWEAVDNFPIRLLKRLVGEDPGQPLAIGFDCRTRGFVPADLMKWVGKLAERDDIVVTTVFLDCAGHELERRFNETRRRHHLAQDLPLSTGIAAERELMGPLRRWAEVLIDTSNFSTNDLQQRIREQFAASAPQGLTVTVSSFAFSRGMPPVADLVFDMRYLDNPHWRDELRELTGQDDAVAEHIRADPAFGASFPQLRDLLLDLLPRYAAQGKRYVTIAFGCTGGRHRSIVVAEAFAARLRESGWTVIVRHRDTPDANPGADR